MQRKKLIFLVTGGAGFIGSHVVDYLIKENHKVFVLDNLSGGKKENINPSAIFIKGSITNNRLIEFLFKKHKFDYVFHLAAYAAEGLSYFIKRFNYNNNLIGSVNLINAAVNSGTVKCFIYTSSIAVYGENQVPMNEKMIPQPKDPYGIAKYAVEQDLNLTHKIFGLPFIIFRPHNVYGVRQNIADKYRNVIGIFMNQAMKREPFTIFGDGKQKRAFSYIDNVAPVIAYSYRQPKAFNQIFNIGAGKPYTINYLAKVVAQFMGVNFKARHLPARNEVKLAFSSHRKVKKYFTNLIKQDIGLEEGIHKMADWAKKIGPQKTKKFENIEVEKNLPLSWTLHEK